MGKYRMVLGTPNQSNKTPGTTYYWMLATALTKLATDEATTAVLYRTAWTASLLEVNVYNNDTTGTSTIKLGKGTSTPLTYTGTPNVSFGAGVEGWMTDLTNTVSFNGSTEYGAIECVCSSGGSEFSVGTVAVTCTTATTETVQFIGAQGCEITSASEIRNGTLTQGGPWSSTAPEAERQNYIDFAATARNFYQQIGTNSHTSAIDVGLKLNGTATAIIVQPSATPTTGVYEDTTHTVAVASGDRLGYYVDSKSGSGFIAGANTHFELVNSNGYAGYWQNWGAATAYNAGSTYYFPISAIHGPQRGATDEQKQAARFYFSGRASSLRGYAATNTLSGNCVVTLRKNQAATGLTFTWATTETGLKSDTTNVVYFDADDELTVEVACAAGTGSMAGAWFSFVVQAADVLKPVIHHGG